MVCVCECLSGVCVCVRMKVIRRSTCLIMARFSSGVISTGCHWELIT